MKRRDSASSNGRRHESDGVAIGPFRPEAVKRGRAANRALGWREAQAQHSQLAQPPVNDVSGDMKSGQF